jgi:hypothetical protein
MASKKKKPKKKTAQKKPTKAAQKKPKKSAPKKAPAKKASGKLTSRAADPRAFNPGVLVTHGDGVFSLTFSDFPSEEAFFEEHGLEGGGYTWHGLVDHLLKEEAPSARKALEFDPESSMFAVRSKDLAALSEVAKALRKLEDMTLVKKLIATVDFSSYD